MDDRIVLIDEVAELRNDLPPWIVLLVDDDPMVHDVTVITLDNFSYKGRRLEFVSCYSAAEAESILAVRNDIQVILLDVVMETTTAGLDLVPKIRGSLANRHVRIIVRTGQPGFISEEQVIHDYAINDYLNKTDLTPASLGNAIVFALRDYEDMAGQA